MNNLNCLTKKKTKKYLLKINNFYNYNNNVIDFFLNKYKICKPKFIINYKKIHYKRKKSLLKLFNIVIKLLNSNNIEYWLDSGTLLGAVRNNKMMEWDDDIDIAIYKDYEKLLKVIKNFPKKKIYFKIWPKEKKQIIKNNKSTLIQVFFINNKQSVFIDLIYHVNYKGKILANYENWKHLYYLKKDIYPLKKITFENKKYNCVNNPIPYLNTSYKFWKHLVIINHSHIKNLNNIVNKNIFYKIKDLISNKNLKKNKNLKENKNLKKNKNLKEVK